MKMIFIVVKSRRTQNPYNSYFNYIFDTSEKLIKLLKDFKKWTNKLFFVTVSRVFLQFSEHTLPKRHLLVQN